MPYTMPRDWNTPEALRAAHPSLSTDEAELIALRCPLRGTDEWHAREMLRARIGNRCVCFDSLDVARRRQREADAASRGGRDWERKRVLDRERQRRNRAS